LFPRRKASFGESLFLGENYITVSRGKKREKQINNKFIRK
jgi:hypothetical protein